MVYPHVEDEFDEAMRPPTSSFHGQISTQAWRVAWPKGDFKARQVFDANMHKGDNWQTGVMVNIVVTPLDPTRKLITRETPTFAREYNGVIRPSIEALTEAVAKIKGIDVKATNPLREINELWVAGEFVPRPDNKTGETWTTIKFTHVFATKGECEAHAGATPQAENHAPAAEATGDPQRATLANFLPALWAQAGKDAGKFAELLKANPLLAAFTMDSPEVRVVMAC
jgi:hypothetical protein